MSTQAEILLSKVAIASLYMTGSHAPCDIHTDLIQTIKHGALPAYINKCVDSFLGISTLTKKCIHVQNAVTVKGVQISLPAKTTTRASTLIGKTDWVLTVDIAGFCPGPGRTYGSEIEHSQIHHYSLFCA